MSRITSRLRAFHRAALTGLDQLEGSDGDGLAAAVLMGFGNRHGQQVLVKTVARPQVWSASGNSRRGSRRSGREFGVLPMRMVSGRRTARAVCLVHDVHRAVGVAEQERILGQGPGIGGIRIPHPFRIAHPATVGATVAAVIARRLEGLRGVVGDEQVSVRGQSKNCLYAQRKGSESHGNESRLSPTPVSS